MKIGDRVKFVNSPSSINSLFSSYLEELGKEVEIIDIATSLKEYQEKINIVIWDKRFTEPINNSIPWFKINTGSKQIWVSNLCLGTTIISAKKCDCYPGDSWKLAAFGCHCGGT